MHATVHIFCEALLLKPLHYTLRIVSHSASAFPAGIICAPAGLPALPYDDPPSGSTPGKAGTKLPHPHLQGYLLTVHRPGTQH
jgi:hypothetical protein